MSPPPDCTRAKPSNTAVKPTRCEPPTSKALTSSRNVSASHTTAALRRSANGKVVEASVTARMWLRSSFVPRQSRAAATARVMLSSSQLANARVPLALALNCGAYQALACTTAARCNRKRGT